MILGQGNPPGERPALGQREGQPRDPETGAYGHGGQIRHPQMVRVLRGNDTFLRLWRLVSGGLGCWLLFEDAAYGSLSQVQTCPGEDLGDLHLAQHGAKRLQPLDEVSHEVGELIDWLWQLRQGSGALFIDAAHPRRDCGCGDQERLGRLLQRPSACGLDFEDCHALGGRVEWALMRRNPGHADVFDAYLFAEECIVLQSAV
jgi:hypothetical protein